MTFSDMFKNASLCMFFLYAVSLLSRPPICKFGVGRQALYRVSCISGVAEVTSVLHAFSPYLIS
jgi:hypothetical protein